MSVAFIWASPTLRLHCQFDLSDQAIKRSLISVSMAALWFAISKCDSFVAFPGQVLSSLMVPCSTEPDPRCSFELQHGCQYGSMLRSVVFCDVPPHDEAQWDWNKWIRVHFFRSGDGPHLPILLSPPYFNVPVVLHLTSSCGVAEEVTDECDVILQGGELFLKEMWSTQCSSYHEKVECFFELFKTASGHKSSRRRPTTSTYPERLVSVDSDAPCSRLYPVPALKGCLATTLTGIWQKDVLIKLLAAERTECVPEHAHALHPHPMHRIEHVHLSAYLCAVCR